MNVLIVNTSELTGGAAVAANRLMHALTTAGVEVRMLVRDKQTQDTRVTAIGGPLALLPKIYERLCIFIRQGLSRKHLWEADIANVGLSITSHPLYRWADVIHINWVNQGMLSLKEIERIAKDGKRIVWTLHDAWNATAVCHYTHSCNGFETGCKDCPILPGAEKVWKRKEHLYANSNISFVTCSEWLKSEVLRSPLMKGQSITAIPNTIDTSIFCPRNKVEARKALSLPQNRPLVLFVSQKVTDERKGARYLIEALKGIDCDVMILGGKADEVASRMEQRTYALGYVNDAEKIAHVYRAADVFVLPSLQDNLPNTIMEALACGVPCVGFNTGGIPEMIDHKVNGYIASLQDTQDLAEGIRFCLDKEHWQELSDAAVDKVERSYSHLSVAKRYNDLYKL